MQCYLSGLTSSLHVNVHWPSPPVIVLLPFSCGLSFILPSILTNVPVILQVFHYLEGADAYDHPLPALSESLLFCFGCQCFTERNCIAFCWRDEGEFRKFKRGYIWNNPDEYRSAPRPVHCSSLTKQWALPQTSILMGV